MKTLLQNGSKHPQLLATLPSKDSGVKYRLEGYLFPATYDYGKETTVEELIDQNVGCYEYQSVAVLLQQLIQESDGQ